MNHRLRILSFLSFFFWHLINFLKAPADLEFLISTVRLFYSLMQLRGNKGLMTEADMALKE